MENAPTPPVTFPVIVMLPVVDELNTPAFAFDKLAALVLPPVTFPVIFTDPAPEFIEP